MSKLKRLLGVLSIVSLFTFSSCVDDTVSPEVTALRNAQVALLNANTSVEAATAALINAQVAAQTINNTFNSANNAILLQLAGLDVLLKQAKVDSAAAQLEVVLAKAETDLVKQSEELAEAAQALEAYLATAGLVQAQEYLAKWNELMFGGAAALEVAGGADGIVASREQIARKQHEIATTELYLGGDEWDGFRAAIVLANRQANLADAQTTLATRTTQLTAAEQALAGFVDPTTAVRAELLANRVQKLALDKSRDSLTALITTSEDAINKATAFRNDIRNGVFDMGTKRWYDATLAITAATTSRTTSTGVKTAWEGYATRLKAVYDTYLPLLGTAKADLDAAATAAGVGATTTGMSLATATLYFNNEVAYTNALLAEVTLRAKGGVLATAADTTAYVNARLAWDGVRRADIFDGAFVANQGITADETLMITQTTPSVSGTYPAKPGFGSLANIGGLGGTAGTLKALNDGIAVPVNDAVAVARYQILKARYENAINDFDALNKLITDLNAGTSTRTAANGAFVRPSTVAVADITVIVTNQSGFVAMDAALLKAAQDSRLVATATATALATFNTSVADAVTNIADQTAIITEQTAIRDNNAPFLAPYKAEYDAALATIAGGTFKRDSLNIPVRVALYSNQLALNTNATAFTQLGQTFNTLTQGAYRLGTDLNPTNAMNYSYAPFTSQATLETNVTNAKNNLKAAQEGVERAETSLLEYANDLTRDTALLASLKSELTALQTRLTVLEALLAKYQELVLAAIAG